MNGLPRFTVAVAASLVLFGFYPGRIEAENTQIRFDANLSRHLEIRNLTSPRAPSIVNFTLPDFVDSPTTILFTFADSELNPQPAYSSTLRGQVPQATPQSRRVSIAFAHEGWSILHPLTKVDNSDLPVRPGQKPASPVFFLYYELERADQERIFKDATQNGQVPYLEYRLVVDGVWMADPLNTLSTRKLNGALISLVDLRAAPPPPVLSPEILAPSRISPSDLARMSPEQAELSALANSGQARTVILRFVGDPGQDVFVAGTFNQFDPYVSMLEPSGFDPRHPGKTVYEIALRLLPGQYVYQFAINGKNFLDPLNIRQGYGPEGSTYSLLHVQ